MRCDEGKTRYESHHRAIKTLIAWNHSTWKKGSGKRVPIRTYKCPFCHSWHLTSQPQRRTTKEIAPPVAADGANRKGKHMPLSTPILPSPVPASKHHSLTTHPVYVRGRRELRAAYVFATLAGILFAGVIALAVTR